MKDKDLDLAAKATELNRQQFESAIRYFEGEKIARWLRVKKLGISQDGFIDQRAENRWLNPIDQDADEMFRRHNLVNRAIKVLLDIFKLTDNFSGAVRYLLLQNKIGHIPGNFTIEYTSANRKIRTEYHDLPKTGEKILENKLRSELFKILRPKSVARRDRKNAGRDNREAELARMKRKEQKLKEILVLLLNCTQWEQSVTFPKKPIQNVYRLSRKPVNATKSATDNFQN